MEVAGLVLGIAGLYTVCTEIVDQFDSYRDFGIASSQLAARFEAEKLRLREWADVAGIQGGTLAEQHHRRLDDLAVRAIVYQILHSIVDLFPRTEQTLFDIRGKPVKSAGQDNRALTTFKVSKKAKIKWAFGNEARFTRQVEAFELLTSKLYDLVPLDQSIELGDAAAVIQSGLSGTSIKDIQLLSNVHEDLRILLEANKNKALAEDRRAAFEFLKPPQVSEDFDNSLSKCLSGTCEWVFQLPDLQAWLAPTDSKSTRLLWLNGTAGSGKSVLCSRVVSHLKTLPLIHCFYFFCTTHVQAGGKLDDIIRVWLFEMIETDQSCLEAMIEIINQLEKSMLSSHVWNLFSKLVTELGNCVFVIDGLDEFNKIDDQRQTFMEKLKTALVWTESRILITSRDEVDLRRGIEGSEKGVSIAIHKISQADTEADVNLFSQEIVKQKLGTKDKEFRTELAATLAGRSEGMFLWVALSGKYLRGGLSKARILQTIKNVPDGLVSAYNRSWKFILDQPEYEKSRALNILGWCVASIRPLTIAELTVALIIDTNHNGPIDMTDLPDEINDEYINGEIIDLCSSLVETRSSLEHESLAKRTVHIVHFSVKDFLSSVAAELERHKNEAECHLELARRCLHYLCYTNIKSDVTEAANVFYEYAINHWHLHQTLSKLKDDSLNKLVIEFFTLHENKFLEWAGILEKNLPLKSNASSTTIRPSPIYFAASLNLTSPLQSLIETSKVDLNRVAGKLGTPLHAACYHGHIEILNLLINSAIDIDNPEGLYGTALHIAAGENHPELVKVLVKHKASTGVRTDGGQTPLWIAAANGYGDTLKYLLESDADISLPEVGGWTPLNIAAINGHLSIVETLLEAGAEMTPTPDGQTPLHSAAMRGHLDIVRTLLNHGATHLTSTTAGWTPLHSACQEQRIEMIKFLLSLSTADINETSQGGYSPIDTVARLGNLELVKLLSDNGADLTLGTDMGFNSLHIASSAGHLPVVQFLLERDPNLIHLTTKTGCTPLYSAASGECGQPDVLAFLLSKWPEKIDITCENWTPLNAAARSGHQQCVELLLDHDAAVNIPEVDGQTPLYSAASIGHLEIVRALLNHGANTTLTIVSGSNALMTAARDGSLEVVKILIERAGMDISAVANDGGTVLHVAALNGHPNIVQYLVDKGGKVTASANANNTVLHNAVRHGSVEVVKVLLNNGADASLSSTTDDGNTPLHLASSLGHSQLIELLIYKGANISARNSTGMTSLNLAALEGHLDVVKILLRKGADMQPNDEEQTPLNNAAYHGYSEIVEIFLDLGAEVNVLNKMQWTPMHAACQGNHVATVKFLLDRGADLMIPNAYGTFPLHTAAKHDSSAMMRSLVDRGANVHQSNKEGVTPLMLAARENRIEVVQYLFDHGADVNYRSEHGYSALLTACYYQQIDVAKFLLSNGAEVNAMDDRNYTPLTVGLTLKLPEIVRILLDHGANIDITDDQNRTTLHWAARIGSLDILERIFEARPWAVFENRKSRGRVHETLPANNSHKFSKESNETIEVNLPLRNHVSDQPSAKFSIDQHCDSEGKTPLHFAVTSGNVACAEYLVSKGYDMNILDVRGRSMVDYGCMSGSVKMLAWIFEHFQSKDVNQTSWSYLHWACRTGNFLLVKLLYDMGHRATTVKNEDLQASWSPLDIARYYQNDRIISASGKLSDEPWHQIKDENMFEASTDSKAMPVFSNSLVAQGLKFRGYCDGCLSELHGPRFHCLDCPDFDYCMMCKHDAHISHPDHQWKVIEPS